MLGKPCPVFDPVSDVVGMVVFWSVLGGFVAGALLMMFIVSSNYRSEADIGSSIREPGERYDRFDFNAIAIGGGMIGAVIGLLIGLGNL